MGYPDRSQKRRRGPVERIVWLLEKGTKPTGKKWGEVGRRFHIHFHLHLACSNRSWDQYQTIRVVSSTV